MSNLQKQASGKVLHPQAQTVAEGYIEDFADALMLQSKTIAAIQGADEVQSVHVSAARNIILASFQKAKRSSELYVLFGSVLLGAFLQGFLSEYSNGRPGWMVFYVGLGMVGTLVTFNGFRR